MDDEPALRRTLERALGAMGYDVVSAGDPLLVYELLDAADYDLVILDIHLPQLSGDTLAIALLRRWPRLAERLLLMTGDPWALRSEWPEELRRCPLLVKPFTLDGLAGIVRGRWPLRRRRLSASERRMTAGLATSAPAEPLATLREYRALAPWGLRDLAAPRRGHARASGVVPVNAAARARPSERTIRFYVTRGLVSPPDGRGTAAVYSYRHLLQVLAIKLRQMEGATLEALNRELAGMTGDLIERRVAGALGPALPRPERLALLQAPGTGRGRVGRAVLGWLTPVEGAAAAARCAAASPWCPASSC